jgi:flagellar hook-length control protein FliK
MTAQLNIPTFLPGPDQASFGSKSRTDTGKDMAVTFENILNTASSKSISKRHVGRRDHGKGDECTYIRYAEVTGINRNKGFSAQSGCRIDKISGISSESSAHATGKYSSIKELTENERELENRVDWMIEGISLILGIGADEFRALIEYSDIGTGHLIDRTSLVESAQKLGSFLDLDSEHTQIIARIFDRVFSMADVLAGEFETDSEAKEFDNLADLSKLSEALTEDDNWIRYQKVDTSETLKIAMMKIKSKLQEMAHGFQEAPESMYADIQEDLRMLSALKNLRHGSRDFISEEGETADHPVLNREISAKVIYERMENGESSWISGNDKAEILFTEKATQPDEVYNGEFIPENPIIWKVFDDEVTSQVEAYTLKDNLHKMEIINQVINKAKVVLNGEKSEMIVQLKPESLGRLSLKLVSDNGVLTAKFITENQQVKQVLETNLQTLKSALEEQGLNVQGFSVFVRQDSSDEPGQSSRLAKSSRVPQAGSIEEDLAEPGDITEAVYKLNAYEWSERTIDLIV